MVAFASSPEVLDPAKDSCTTKRLRTRLDRGIQNLRCYVPRRRCAAEDSRRMRSQNSVFSKEKLTGFGCGCNRRSSRKRFAWPRVLASPSNYSADSRLIHHFRVAGAEFSVGTPRSSTASLLNRRLGEPTGRHSSAGRQLYSKLPRVSQARLTSSRYSGACSAGVMCSRMSFTRAAMAARLAAILLLRSRSAVRALSS
jgi:hypothetical protein